jgi:hypothetical protein
MYNGSDIRIILVFDSSLLLEGSIVTSLRFVYLPKECVLLANEYHVYVLYSLLLFGVKLFLDAAVGFVGVFSIFQA